MSAGSQDRWSVPRQSFRLDWSQFRPVAALYCLPAIIGVLIAGLLSHHTIPALVACTGTLIVGFGAFQPSFHNPRTPMIAVAIGMSLSAGIGTIANAWFPVEVLCVALWGAGVALMNLVGQGPGWLALQGAIALIVAASFPATPLNALYRLLLVLSGATLQLCVLLVLHWLAPKPFDAMRAATAPSLSITSALRQVRDILAGRLPGFGYTLALATAVASADALVIALHLPNGYWVAMTVLLIARPDARETETRAIARFAGTIVSAGVLTILMAVLRPAPPSIVILIAFTAWSCFAFMLVNYAVLSLCVTAYVVLLFALAGLPEPTVALDRTIATALGGMIALLAHTARRRFAVP